MKKKKLIAIILTTVMMVSGCSQASKSTSTTEQAKTAAEEKLPEVLKITIARPIFTKSPQGTAVQDEWKKEMEAYLGTTLDITWEDTPWADYNTKLATYMAAGDWADIFTVMDNDDQVSEFGSTDMLLNLNDYKDDSKNFRKYTDTSNEALRVTSPDGGRYFFSDLNKSSYNGTQELIAADVNTFEKENLKIPSTLTELYDTSKKLKELYPASYPINSDHWHIINTMLNAYNTQNSIYYDGSKYQYGPLSENFKKTLQYINKLYSAKLLDPEFLTQTAETMYEKILNKKSFIDYTYGSFVDEKINRVSGYNAKYGDIPLFKADEVGTTPWYTSDQKKGSTIDKFYKIVINAETKYPATMVKMVDYQYSDKMINLLNWGIEGTTYKVVDGKNVFIDDIMNAPSRLDKLAEYGINASNSVRSGIQFAPQDRDVSAACYPAVPSYLDGNFSQNLSCWAYYDKIDSLNMAKKRPTEPPIVFNSEENEKKAAEMTPVQTYVNESIDKFITGELSFDKWDEYLKEIKSMGDYESVLKIYNDKVGQLK